MYDRAYAVATGAFVVAAIAVLLLTAYWLAGVDQERRPYVVVSAHSVAGLSVGSEVLYRGVPAGRVDRIRIDPDDPAQVLVRIVVNPDVPVRESTFARLQQRGLTGSAQLELAGTEASAEALPTSPDRPARIPMVPSLLDEVTDAGTQAFEILNEITDTLSEALNEENRERLRSVAVRLDNLLTSAEQVARTLEAELPRTMSEAAEAADSVETLATRAAESMDEVDLLIADLRETAAVARRVGEEFSDTSVLGLDRALETASAAAREVARLARELARQPESVLRGRRPSPGPGEE